MNEIKEYTRDDFLQGVEPYEYLYQYKDDGFTLERLLVEMSAQAAKVKVTNFKTLWRSYLKDQQKKTSVVQTDYVTNFEGQEIELNSGRWQADDYGVTTETVYGEVYACVHPILPVLRLVNIDTGVEKLKLAYRKGKQWRYVIADKKMVASSNSIIGLAEVGIAVTSENAKYLVRYLHDIENLNYDLIPEKNSVSRMGWIDGEGFSPYVDDLVFDGDANFRTFFESVKEGGKLDRWLETAKQVRRESVYARVILAGSFASALVKPLACLPFFVHLWGGTEAGKTVGLMLAASVWANPEIGRFIHTFNSTAVGREKSAAFVNSLPLILDELQIIKDRKEFDKDIYMLAEGAGRTRGNKSGGVDKTPTWANCILTSGEMPITGSASGAGAVNRIIEIECKERLFTNPRDVADSVKKNYGFAGKLFVERLKDSENMQQAERLFRQYYAELSESDTTEKQAMAAALLLTADRLATEWIFQDDAALTAGDIADFLQTKSAVSVSERAYECIAQYVVSNKNKFCGDSELGEVWGKIEGNTAYIIKGQFERICAENGFNSRAVLSWMKQNGVIEVAQKGYTKLKRINGIPVHCVWLRLQAEDFVEADIDIQGIF